MACLALPTRLPAQASDLFINGETLQIGPGVINQDLTVFDVNDYWNQETQNRYSGNPGWYNMNWDNLFQAISYGRDVYTFGPGGSTVIGPSAKLNEGLLETVWNLLGKQAVGNWDMVIDNASQQNVHALTITGVVYNMTQAGPNNQYSGMASGKITTSTVNAYNIMDYTLATGSWLQNVKWANTTGLAGVNLSIENGKAILKTGSGLGLNMTLNSSLQVETFYNYNYENNVSLGASYNWSDQNIRVQVGYDGPIVKATLSNLFNPITLQNQPGLIGSVIVNEFTRLNGAMGVTLNGSQAHDAFFNFSAVCNY